MRQYVLLLADINSNLKSCLSPPPVTHTVHYMLADYAEISIPLFAAMFCSWKTDAVFKCANFLTFTYFLGVFTLPKMA